MRTIDLQSWPRRRHFELYSGFDHPHFGLCASVDLTTFYPAIKQRGTSISLAIVHAITHTANAIPEFRTRIRGDDVVEHEVVNASFTIGMGEDLFSFCTVTYYPEFAEFAEHAARQIAAAQVNPELEYTPQQDDVLYMTAIPWVSFTGFMHPMQLHPADSIPRFAWGKFFQEGDQLKMPLSVQGHHALLDGYHVGKFYQLVQDYFNQFEIG
ncbi:MAG: CatA-like O-acetyltransferase [Anaerolineales bacterium]|jgi:chloramphenicol O-acetyltransferase type A